MKITQKNIISVQDWDDLVKETYNKPYSLQQQNGCQDRGVCELTVPEKETNDYENNVVPEIVNGEEMGVSFKAWLARDPKQPLKLSRKDKKLGDFQKNIETEQWCIDLWWKRNFYPNISMVANDLYAKGLLPAGEYLINIDW
jgi:hypothetical protein